MDNLEKEFAVNKDGTIQLPRSATQEDTRRVAARFTWDRHVEDLKGVYRETLSTGRRAA
ncbi:MAG: hypothetical protein N2C14_14850 [Planctomycetales bacterium]